MFTEDKNKLIGLKVDSLLINSDETLLVLKTDKGEKKLYVTADCCSSSWIENISGVDNLVGHTILSIEETNIGELEKDEYEYIKSYSVLMKTNKGNFEIEYRNSSNGYYGGDIELENKDGEPPYRYSGDDNLKELTSDF